MKLTRYHEKTVSCGDCAMAPWWALGGTAGGSFTTLKKFLILNFKFEKYNKVSIIKYYIPNSIQN